MFGRVVAFFPSSSCGLYAELARPSTDEQQDQLTSYTSEKANHQKGKSKKAPSPRRGLRAVALRPHQPAPATTLSVPPDHRSHYTGQCPAHVLSSLSVRLATFDLSHHVFEQYRLMPTPVMFSGFPFLSGQFWKAVESYVLVHRWVVARSLKDELVLAKLN